MVPVRLINLLAKIGIKMLIILHYSNGTIDDALEIVDKTKVDIVFTHASWVICRKFIHDASISYLGVDYTVEYLDNDICIFWVADETSFKEYLQTKFKILEVDGKGDPSYLRPLPAH